MCMEDSGRLKSWRILVFSDKKSDFIQNKLEKRKDGWKREGQGGGGGCSEKVNGQGGW